MIQFDSYFSTALKPPTSKVLQYVFYVAIWLDLIVHMDDLEDPIFDRATCRGRMPNEYYMLVVSSDQYFVNFFCFAKEMAGISGYVS